MPHISSKELDKTLSDKIFKDLILILNKSQNRNIFSGVMGELLTDTDKIMMAKRIAMILMLSSKTPHRSIISILKVSPSTVATVSLKIEIGKYDYIIKASQKERIDLEKIVWNLMTAGGLMPPKLGRRYWRKYSR